MPPHLATSMPRGASTSCTAIHSPYSTGGHMRSVYTLGAPRMLWRGVGVVLVSWVAVGPTQHPVIGLDNKIDIDDAGKQVPPPPREEGVGIVDIPPPGTPPIVGAL